MPPDISAESLGREFDLLAVVWNLDHTQGVGDGTPLGEAVMLYKRAALLRATTALSLNETLTRNQSVRELVHQAEGLIVEYLRA